MFSRQIDRQTGYPSIDRPWLQFYKEPWDEDMVPRITVYRNILQNNQGYEKEVAINFKGFKTSFQAMFEMTEKIAKALLASGIHVGDCVNMCVSYVPEAVVLVLACIKIGALANFMNPLFTTEQMRDRIRDTHGKILIILDDMFPYISDAVKQIETPQIVILPSINSIPQPVQLLVKQKRKPSAELQTFIAEESGRHNNS